MAELARGAVTDRPWGRTLATLGLRGVTGQVTITAEGKKFQVAFEQGAVVAAASPLGSDAAVRVAMTSHLVSSTQVAEIARKQAAAPDRDEIEAIAELARLAPDQALRLRRRVIGQRAARTFSLDRGEFVVDDQISLRVVPGSELEIRAIIYLGAKQFLSEARLNSDLGLFGQWFQLKPEAVDDLAQYGFGEAERPVLAALGPGAGLAELETADREQRMVRAVVYSLVTSGACAVDSSARAPQAKAAASVARAAAQRAVDPAALKDDPGIDAATIPSMKKSQKLPTRKPGDEAQITDITALIQSRLKDLDNGADHFTLLGVLPEASEDQIRTAYFTLARQLHPDRLAALGIADDNRRAQRLFAEVNAAFSVLSDTKRRWEYSELLKRGGEAAVRAEQEQAELVAQRVLESEEAFRRGEMALRRGQNAVAIQELERAIALNTDEPDYHAALAWAKFCEAPDKLAIADTVRATLERAIKDSPRAVTPRFYLGRIERMLGRDREAHEHFQAVVKLSPGHAEASSEIRIIEARQVEAAEKEKPKDKGGIFSRLKR